MKQPIQRTPEQIAKLAITAGSIELPTVQALKELDPLQHDVFDESKRKRKPVKKPTGVKDKDGKEIMTTTMEDVNRIAIPFQELIVKRRVAFMNVGELELRAKPKTNVGSDVWTDEEKLFEIVKKIREDNKMQYRETDVAKRMLTELQVAKLWYTDDVDAGYWGDLAPTSKKSVRCKILSPALGDKLYPVFDGYGKMVYFARSFKSKPNLLDAEDMEAVADVKEKEVLEVYSKDKIWTFEQEAGVWIPKNEEPHTFGKIPVIYYQKDNAPWANVQPIINRIEEVLSNFADTTDYNGSPILVGVGKITGMAERGERGKTFMMETGASLQYVTWDQAPEAIKLELETLVNLVYTCTQTPDISTKGMAELAIESGVAFDRVFIDAHLAAKDEIAGGYGECTQREINLLKAIAVNVINTGLKKVNLEIGFNIPLFRINDARETVDTVSTAYMGGLISQETAVGLSGLTDDAGEEYERIKKENDTLGNEVEEFE